jgi:hypothetical protein
MYPHVGKVGAARAHPDGLGVLGSVPARQDPPAVQRAPRAPSHRRPGRHGEPWEDDRSGDEDSIGRPLSTVSVVRVEHATAPPGGLEAEIFAACPRGSQELCSVISSWAAGRPHPLPLDGVVCVAQDEAANALLLRSTLLSGRHVGRYLRRSVPANCDEIGRLASVFEELLRSWSAFEDTESELADRLLRRCGDGLSSLRPFAVAPATGPTG